MNRGHLLGQGKPVPTLLSGTNADMRSNGSDQRLQLLENQGIVFKKKWGRTFRSGIRLLRRRFKSPTMPVFIN